MHLFVARRSIRNWCSQAESTHREIPSTAGAVGTSVEHSLQRRSDNAPVFDDVATVLHMDDNRYVDHVLFI